MGAGELGVAIKSPWLTWFKGAFLPALVGLAVTPLILYQVQPDPRQNSVYWTACCRSYAVASKH